MNRKMPLRTVATAAVSVGVLTFASIANVCWNVPIAAQAATSDGTMSDEDIRDAWKNFKVTITDGSGIHNIDYASAVVKNDMGFPDIKGESYDAHSRITDISMTGVPEGWTMADKSYSTSFISKFGLMIVSGSNIQDIYTDGTHFYAISFSYGQNYPSDDDLWQMFKNMNVTSEGSKINVDFQKAHASFSTLSRNGKAPQSVAITNIPSDYELASFDVSDNSKDNNGWASKATIVANFISKKYPSSPYKITFDWTNQAATQADVAKIDAKNNNNANSNTNTNSGNTNNNATNTNENDNTVNTANTNSQANSNSTVAAANSSSSPASSSSNNELVQTGVDDMSFIVPLAAASALAVSIPMIKRKK